MRHPLSLYELAKLATRTSPSSGSSYPEPTRSDHIPRGSRSLAARFLPGDSQDPAPGTLPPGGAFLRRRRRLRARPATHRPGPEVSLLALFDTWGKGLSERPLVPAENRSTTSSTWPDELPRAARLSLRKVGSSPCARSRPTSAGTRSRPPSRTRADTIDDHAQDIGMINHLAYCQYQPRPYPGRAACCSGRATPNWVGY